MGVVSGSGGSSGGVVRRRRLLALAPPLVFLGRPGRRKAEATPLAPLGRATRVGTKRLGLSPSEVMEYLRQGLQEGQYFVNPSGLPVFVFDDECRFKDPTNDVVGLSRYQKALGILFDESKSKVKLESIEVVEGEQKIKARYLLGGTLKLPWRPCVPEYGGVVTYTLSDETGLVVSQDQEWTISAAEALRETFTPCRAPS